MLEVSRLTITTRSYSALYIEFNKCPGLNTKINGVSCVQISQCTKATTPLASKSNCTLASKGNCGICWHRGLAANIV